MQATSEERKLAANEREGGRKIQKQVAGGLRHAAPKEKDKKDTQEMTHEPARSETL